jgi:hypothetical protein
MIKKEHETVSELTASQQVLRERRMLNIIYGGFAGMAFAIGMWGLDAYLLSQAHAYLPWLKLALGIILCAAVAGTASWLASRREMSLVSLLIWIVSALLLAFLTVSIPLQIITGILGRINPELAGHLDYSISIGYISRLWIAIIWITIFVVISGILQSALVDSAAFSTSTVGKFIPLMGAAVLMGISGVLMDDLVNARFRNAIYSVDSSIEFNLAHPNGNYEFDEGRIYHASALQNVIHLISQDHRLVVQDFDETLEIVKVLIQFEDGYVVCGTVYGQANFCELAEAGN